MNKKQQENTAKYLYDLSKGIALIAVIGNIFSEKQSIKGLILGFIMALVFYFWGFYIDREAL